MTELEEWSATLATALGVEVTLDIGRILDLARVAAHEVDRPAAPLTAYLVGYAAGLAAAGSAGDPTALDRAVTIATERATGWATRA